MKKKLSLLLLALTVPMLACAGAVAINGIMYDLYEGTNTATVTYQNDGYYSGKVVIPASVTYNEVVYRVTSIGISAFFGCSNLNSVTIPNSVTSICREAFSYSGVTSVTIPNSVTTIDYWAFRFCSGLTDVTIGNSVASIGFQAFYGCSSLTSVTIPNSVTSIGVGAFSECSGLISVSIPNSVTSIGDSAFSGCSALTSVTIPNSITSIETAVFYNCTSLVSVIIPNSVTSIGASAFERCSLTTLTIPSSITSIGDQSFTNCSALTSVTIPNSVTSIGESVFYGCNNLKKVVTKIEYPQAFDNNVFTQTAYEQAWLIVPVGKVNTYKATSGWKNFMNITEPTNTDDPQEGHKAGDLTGDGEVNGTDLVQIVNYILQGNYNEAADLNGDGQVNGTDLVALVNLIMDAEPSNAREVMTRNNDISNTSVGIEPLHIGAGESRKMTISVSNPDMDVTMMQFDMVLPKGLRVNRIGNYMEYELTDRTSSDKHSAYIRDNGDFTRVLIASGTNAILDGAEGGVIRLTLTADDDFEGGNIEFRNMLWTSPDLHEARPHSFTAYIAGNATDIQEINSESTGSAIYNLSGQRLKTTHKGLNIVNGKKVMVK